MFANCINVNGHFGPDEHPRSQKSPTTRIVPSIETDHDTLGEQIADKKQPFSTVRCEAIDHLVCQIGLLSKKIGQQTLTHLVIE